MRCGEEGCAPFFSRIFFILNQKTTDDLAVPVSTVLYGT